MVRSDVGKMQMALEVGPALGSALGVRVGPSLGLENLKLGPDLKNTT